MDLVVDFITENYIWIIVAGVVILMAVVGYIADKTDFGRNRVEKQPKEKKEKVKEIKTKEKKKKEKVVEQLPEKQENLQSVYEEEIEQTPMKQEFVDESGLFSNEQIVNDEFTNKDNSIDETQVDQSLFEPLPSIDQVFGEQMGNNAEVSGENVNANSNDTTKNNAEIESDDDIWKF